MNSGQKIECCLSDMMAVPSTVLIVTDVNETACSDTMKMILIVKVKCSSFSEAVAGSTAPVGSCHRKCQVLSRAGGKLLQELLSAFLHWAGSAGCFHNSFTPVCILLKKNSTDAATKQC